MEGLKPKEYSFARKLLKFVYKNDRASDFQHLNCSEIPYYKKIIDRPMSLEKIKKKLAEGRYHSLQDVLDDIDLIWKNCRTFNDVSSEITKRANRLDELTKEFIRNQYSKGKYPVTKEQMINLSEQIAFSSPAKYSDLVSFLRSNYPLSLKVYEKELYMIKIDIIPLSAYNKIEEILK